MLPKLKNSMFLLPLVVWVGSFFGPSEFYWNNYSKDAAIIEEVILHYGEGVFRADSLRIYNSVHPDVVIRGRCFSKDGQENYEEVPFHELLENTGNRKSKDVKRVEKFVKKIVIYDVNDNTATARLTTLWGTEYIHLAKIKQKWYILNVICQPAPA